MALAILRRPVTRVRRTSSLMADAGEQACQLARPALVAATVLLPTGGQGPSQFSVRCIVQCVLTSSTRLDALTRLGRALADPTRCRILLALLDGPTYPAMLASSLELTRSNVSNHLTCLRGCGLIVGTPEGRQMRYELADSNLRHVIAGMLTVVLAVDTDVECLPVPPDSAE